jgi:hypothetical protein
LSFLIHRALAKAAFLLAVNPDLVHEALPAFRAIAFLAALDIGIVYFPSRFVFVSDFFTQKIAGLIRFVYCGGFGEFVWYISPARPVFRGGG